jgi:hypothetical protein
MGRDSIGECAIVENKSDKKYNIICISVLEVKHVI